MNDFAQTLLKEFVAYRHHGLVPVVAAMVKEYDPMTAVIREALNAARLS